MKHYLNILFWLLLLSGNFVFAQASKFYSTEQGLSNSFINRIYQDKKGFIWIATENGLNKFDGTQFVVYRKIPGDSTSLKNNHVVTLLEDSSGNFWISCFSGLMKYDRDTDSFHDFQIYGENGKHLYPTIMSIIERKNGDVWFVTSGDGLFSIKKGETKCEPETLLNEHLSSLFLTAGYEDSNNRLWIGTENSGLNVYSFDTGKLDIYTTNTGKQITSNAISAICEGESGTVFVGTLDDGLNRFDSSNGDITPIYGENEDKHIPVKTLIFTKSRQLYVGTDGNGMKIYNPVKQVLESFEPVSTPFDFHKTKVHSLLEDKDGNIWVGIFQKGVFFIPANPNEFNYYGYKSFKRNSIGSNCVTAIYKDKDDIIWVGTDNDGLYALNDKTQQVRHYKNTDQPNSVPNTIMCIRETNDGQLWIGSYLNGFALFDKQTGTCKFINSQTNNILSSNKVYCMTDDKKGGLWVGTYGGGLYKYDIASQTISTHYYERNETETELANNWINSLLYEDDGNLWIGTFKGLSCLNITNNTFYTYRRENSKIPSNIVYSLKKDRYGNLWIGTDEGLACLNKKTKEIKTYTINDGLLSNEICGIEEDENGNIWLSTLSGISMYSPIKGEFTNYYASDGLQGSEFSRGACFKSADGELFFGGINGITSFFPENIHPKRETLNTYITHFYLFGKAVQKGQKSGNKEILNKSILDVSRISLAAGDNVFSFEFSTLEYGNPEGISYRYRLENFDAEWLNTPPGTNRITYTNLNPGKYQLQFQAVDKENTSEIKTIEIVIRPPWYGTIGAKIVFIILILLLLYAIYYYLSSRIKHRNELLRLEHAEQINEAKLQFFINISHEIRTPMTLIMGPLEKLLVKNKDADLQSTYLLIYRNAQRILRLINQLMDMRKIDRGQMHLKSRETDIVGFIKDIMQAFEYSAQKKNIKFEFNPEMPVLKVWIDLNNLDKVLFNVFSNAFKFTPDEGKITVELTTGTDELTEGPLRDYFEIRVLDTGIGIDKEKIDKIFERFYQIDSEAGNSNFGTGIGLHLARSLVVLQHGIIYAENRTDTQGSCFIIRLPWGNAHLKAEEMEIISGQTPMATFNYSKKEDLFDVENEPEEELSTVSAKTKYRVLIVEDDREINNYIKAELAPIYKVTQLTNGKDALTFISKEKPDLVISDVVMPQMDGITLCRKIKSNVNIDHIPVILLTAKSEEEDYAEGLDTGADAYMVKPFNPEILKKTIANLIANRERLKDKAQFQTEGRINKIELKSYDDILMEKILKVINDNIENPQLNVEMLSSSIGMSRVHMHRKLKELTNQSARDFIRTIRLRQAGELLLTKKYTIAQVCTAVGFATFPHFSNCFKEFYGVSPREYMNGYADVKMRNRKKKD
jgi:signal transduction histidine kinase/ligand-binding sensor domain-containing protein/DNA-binding NarL/FixJ family response regulator